MKATRTIRSTAIRPDTRDRSLMENRERWPQWPFLPIKRYRKDDQMQTAVLYASDPLRVSFGANLWALAATKNGNTADWQETTVDKLIRDGWMVD